MWGPEGPLEHGEREEGEHGESREAGRADCGEPCTPCYAESISLILQEILECLEVFSAFVESHMCLAKDTILAA
jgi:hypothetical protein